MILLAVETAVVAVILTDTEEGPAMPAVFSGAFFPKYQNGLSILDNTKRNDSSADFYAKTTIISCNYLMVITIHPHHHPRECPAYARHHHNTFGIG